jgi:hypothetical protein
MVPGQQAGPGKAAAGFRIPRPSAGELVGRGACWVARVRSLAIPGFFGGGLLGEVGLLGGGLNGAGPAGWLRESGSRLPQSKAFGGGAG